MARGNHTGKRAGPRRPAERTRPPVGRLLLLAVGVTLTAIAWGYLVLAAIDFGTAARDGDTRGWVFLGAASLGAVACLFVTLILLARAVRLLRGGQGTQHASRHASTSAERRPAGSGQSTRGTRRS